MQADPSSSSSYQKRHKRWLLAVIVGALLILGLALLQNAGILSANLHEGADSKDSVAGEKTNADPVALLKEVNERTVQIQWGTLFKGDDAIDIAVLETDCKPLEIHECAPTLQDGYYVSTMGGSVGRYALSSGTPVQLLTGRGEELLPEKMWKDLWNSSQLKSALSRGAIFSINLEKGAVTRLTQVYPVSSL